MKPEIEFKILPEYNKGEIEYHRIHIYKGTLLHVKLTSPDEVKADDIVVEVSKSELYLLSIKKYDGTNKQKDERAKEIISLLEKYVVDTGEYRNFNLIEPLSK